MKSILLLVSFLILVNPAFARHGKGGSITYEYLGVGSASGTSKYRMTVKHYIDCDGTQFIEPASYLGIFDAGSNNLVKTLTIQESSRTTIQKQHFDPCISQPPKVCYVVVTYTSEFELRDNVAGYVLSEQECCRIGGIINIGNSSAYGITNTNIIPGVIGGVIYRTNSSPVFMQKDTVVICHDSYFSMDFSATDADGDKLTYAFSSGKTGGTVQIRQPNPPSSPPYSNLPYVSAYSADQPLGPGVKIGANTGIISGVAPSTLGSYVISVNISEFRNGVLIGVSKKEVQVTVADCTLSAAVLKESYNTCKDFTFQFHNESFANNVRKYYWDFGVPNSSSDTSSAEIPTYTYPDTGRYILKLIVASEEGCEDSATANVLVYPGFDPGFTFTGSCFQSPFQFGDISYAQYGTVNSWLWDFEDNYSASNSSASQNPSHQYGGTGNYKVLLTVGSSKGCMDTSTADILVLDKPFLSLAFRDTLICSIDTLALHANGSGVFSWTPNASMLKQHTASPLVFPKTTTKYLVALDEQG
ncbi:MAG: PKD domain-containing protein, partial [Chitinophagaceae bacterium]